MSQFGYCNFYDAATNTFHEDIFVRILEHTHEKSAVQRYKVLWHSPDIDIEFYKPRERVKLAEPLISTIILTLDEGVTECNLLVSAVFYKNPTEVACHNKTPHIYQLIKLNNKKFNSINQLIKHLDRPHLKNVIMSELLANIEY